jgi:predicted Zn finger-like uncharacterized protein
MLIVCPSCDTSYDVEPASLLPGGRYVRCLRCRMVWHVMPTHADKLLAAATAIGPEPRLAEGMLQAEAQVSQPVVEPPAQAAADIACSNECAGDLRDDEPPVQEEWVAAAIDDEQAAEDGSVAVAAGYEEAAEHGSVLVATDDEQAAEHESFAAAADDEQAAEGESFAAAADDEQVAEGESFAATADDEQPVEEWWVATAVDDGRPADGSVLVAADDEQAADDGSVLVAADDVPVAEDGSVLVAADDEQAADDGSVSVAADDVPIAEDGSVLEATGVEQAAEGKWFAVAADEYDPAAADETPVDELNESAEVEAPPIVPVDLDEGRPPIEIDEDRIEYSHEPLEPIRSVGGWQHLGRARDWSPPRWPMSRLHTGILALLIVDCILVGWRGHVVRAFPQTDSFYKLAGLPVNLRGLAFDDITTTTEQHKGVPILVVEGNIVNSARKFVDVPRLKFVVRNAARQEIYSWTAVPSRTSLPPGEAVSFRTRLASPPPDAHDLLLRFVDRRDIVAAAR